MTGHFDEDFIADLLSKLENLEFSYDRLAVILNALAEEAKQMASQADADAYSYMKEARKSDFSNGDFETVENAVFYAQKASDANNAAKAVTFAYFAAKQYCDGLSSEYEQNGGEDD